MKKTMNGNKVLLFYNPYAGNGLFKSKLDMIIERFQKNGMYILPVRTDNKEVLDNILQEINPKTFRKVIAAGGDGTINILVNSMMRNKVDLPIAIFPSGTANDYAYYFDLPLTIDEMVEVALTENYTYSDIGKINDRYFINVTALGFMVDVSQKTDPNIKSTLGIISYYLRGVREVPKLKPIPIKIASDEYTAEDKIYFMLVMNGRSAGGFKRIAPKAEINDGLFDVMLFREMPVLEIAPLLFKVMAGEHQENKNVVFFQTEKLSIESGQPLSCDIDGEKGPELPVTIEMLPKQLRVNTRYKNMGGAIW